MPDVTRFVSRNIHIPLTRIHLERTLLDWIQETLDSIGQTSAIAGARPATYLLANADGLDLLLQSNSFAARRTVYANFIWGVRPGGDWYIQHVKFGLAISQSDLTVLEKRALFDRIRSRVRRQARAAGAGQ